MSYLNQIDSSYHSELRELNELNFARFDAKLEQRVAQLDAKLEQGLARMEARLERRITEQRGQPGSEFHAACEAMATRLITWMLVLSAGSTLTILGRLLALLKG